MKSWLLALSDGICSINWIIVFSGPSDHWYPIFYMPPILYDIHAQSQQCNLLRLKTRKVYLQFRLPHKNRPDRCKVHRRICMIFWSPSFSKFVRSMIIPARAEKHFQIIMLYRDIIAMHLIWIHRWIYRVWALLIFVDISSRIPKAFIPPIVTILIFCPSYEVWV